MRVRDVPHVLGRDGRDATSTGGKPGGMEVDGAPEPRDVEWDALMLSTARARRAGSSTR